MIRSSISVTDTPALMKKFGPIWRTVISMMADRAETILVNSVVNSRSLFLDWSPFGTPHPSLLSLSQGDSVSWCCLELGIGVLRVQCDLLNRSSSLRQIQDMLACCVVAMSV